MLTVWTGTVSLYDCPVIQIWRLADLFIHSCTLCPNPSQLPGPPLSSSFRSVHVAVSVFMLWGEYCAMKVAAANG